MCRFAAVGWNFPPRSAVRCISDPAAPSRSGRLTFVFPRGCFVLTTLITAVAMFAVADGGLPVAAPATVGMSAKRLETIDRVVTRGIKAGGFPGAAVVVGRKGAAVWEKGFGRIDWATSSTRVSATETIYDLASLTKVIGTTTAVMILYDEGRIQLDSPVREYLPEFTGGYKDSVTVRQLLEHRSGLPADRDLWRIAHSPAEARQVVLDAPLECKPGQCYIYSDLGADHPRHDGRARHGPGSRRVPARARVRAAGNGQHVLQAGRLAQVARRANGSLPAARLSAAGRGARRERVRAGRRRRPRGTVQHGERSLDLRADDARGRRVQGRPHRERLHGASCSPRAQQAVARSVGRWPTASGAPAAS